MVEQSTEKRETPPYPYPERGSVFWEKIHLPEPIQLSESETKELKEFEADKLPEDALLSTEQQIV